MKNDVHFWIATLARGIFALLAGSAVIVIPDMARIVFLMPCAVAISILCLATYGLVDSAIVFITAFMTASRRGRLALLLQGTLGTAVGILLLAVAFEHAQLHWFLYFVALQALFTGAGEFVLARHGVTQSTARWNYGAAVVAALATLSYAMAAAEFGPTLLPSELAWLIFGYLVAFGLAQCLTAARRLYADRKITLLLREAQSQGGTPHAPLDIRHAV